MLVMLVMDSWLSTVVDQNGRVFGFLVQKIVIKPYDLCWYFCILSRFIYF